MVIEPLFLYKFICNFCDYIFKWFSKVKIFTLLSSIVLIVIISIINPTAKQRVINQTFDQMNLTDEKKRKEEGLYIFSKEHTHHYITAYRMYIQII